MGINYLTIIATTVNLILLVIIIIGLYKAIHGVKNFVIRNKEIDKKLDDILNKLENKIWWKTN